ncbi:MAG: hypothetical protein IKR91_04580, partial [Alloprevotella sp.]|nr:hypothetical protein [Alloprevotella sp.]
KRAFFGPNFSEMIFMPVFRAQKRGVWDKGFLQSMFQDIISSMAGEFALCFLGTYFFHSL